MPLSANLYRSFQQRFNAAATIFAGILCALPVYPVWADEEIVKTGFETGEYESTGWRQSGNDPQIARAPEPVCRGEFSLKIPLDRNKDKVSFRTELSLVGNEAHPLRNLEYDNDYWFALSIYLPRSWRPDNKSIDILAQLHGVPDTDQGEVYRNPMFNFHIRGDEWAIATKRDSRRVTATDQAKMEYEEYGFQSLGKTETGKWTSFVFRFRLSYRENEGRIDVWKNGTKIVDNYSRGVGYNDKKGPYWKIGNYKPDWKPGHEPSDVSRRLHYVDEVSSAVGPDRYSDVAPRCGSRSSQPPVTDDKPTPPEPEPAPAPAEDRQPPPSAETKPSTPVIKNLVIERQN